MSRHRKKKEKGKKKGKKKEKKKEKKRKKEKRKKRGAFHFLLWDLVERQQRGELLGFTHLAQRPFKRSLFHSPHIPLLSKNRSSRGPWQRQVPAPLHWCRDHKQISYKDNDYYYSSASTSSLLRPRKLLSLIKIPSVLLVLHKTRGFSCRNTSKEGHAEKSGVVLYVLAAQLSLCVCVIRQISANLLLVVRKKIHTASYEFIQI